MLKKTFDDPHFWKHFWMVWFVISIITIPLSYVLRDSVAYVTVLSHLALTVGFIGAWQAARAEIESQSNPPQ